jgi:hypothetical protein
LEPSHLSSVFYQLTIYSCLPELLRRAFTGSANIVLAMTGADKQKKGSISCPFIK